MSKFYFLPKIHKPGNLGGPIVFACNCPTELIATYLHAITTPLDKTLPSFVNDTNYKHMLYIAKSFRFPNFKSLCFNIPNRDGLLAFQHLLHKRAIPQPSTHTLVRLAEQVLTLNSLLKWEVLESNRRGCNGQPTCDQLRVANLQYTGARSDLCKRYIEDIVGAFFGNKDTIEKFAFFMNGFHPSV